jgi:hypothetical protein
MLLAGMMALPLQPVAIGQEPVHKLNLVIVEGDGAINNIRQRTAREPIVQVEDENHKPVAGAAVIFLLPQHGAGGTFSTGGHSLSVVTDAQGRAVARGILPNGKGPFQIQVNVSYNGMTTTGTISQTNAILAANGSTVATAGISTKLIVILAVVAAAAAGGGIYAATHSGGGSGNTATTGTTITAGAGSVGPPK